MTYMQKTQSSNKIRHKILCDFETQSQPENQTKRFLKSQKKKKQKKTQKEQTNKKNQNKQTTKKQTTWGIVDCENQRKRKK